MLLRVTFALLTLWLGVGQLDHPADGLVCEQPLGVRFTGEGTEFRVWAPGARVAALELGDSLLPMARDEDGSWSVVVPRDCAGLTYRFRVDGRAGIDPYARQVTAYDGHGVVVRDATPVAPRPNFPQQDAIIYELHLRDFTVDPESGVRRKGTFLGLTEEGTRRGDLTTGLDHLTELGVNVVQILPIASFANDGTTYGWGYDSVHFNAPHAPYGTLSELKTMVDALHRRGIRVVLDVVYNHTMESPTRTFSFEALVPGYYYRRREDGTWFNGSGVGNELRSEAAMARRFLLDSTRYWVAEVGVDGFRFDLMGLIDLETMTEIARELRAIDPELLIYGEPWAAGETPIPVTAKGTQRGRGFSVFNDHFRDALKGHVFRPADRGFVQDGRFEEQVRLGIAGSIDDFADSPLESLNYVECHDNHTFWDRLVNSTEGDREAMDRLGAAVLFTSQGIPFIQAGQELRRTKNGEDNSYNLPDSVNMIRWSAKAEHRELYAFYRGMIALRKAHPMFRLPTAKLVREGLTFLDSPPGTVAYRLRDPRGWDSWKEAVVLLNGSSSPFRFVLPTGAWSQCVDDRRASATSLGTRQGEVVVGPHSAAVFGR